MDSKVFGARLKKVLDERGVKYSWAAERMGWSKQLFHSKMLGVTAWKLDEVSKAMAVLDLPKDILM